MGSKRKEKLTRLTQDRHIGFAYIPEDDDLPAPGDISKPEPSYDRRKEVSDTIGVVIVLLVVIMVAFALIKGC